MFLNVQLQFSLSIGNLQMLLEIGLFKQKKNKTKQNKTKQKERKEKEKEKKGKEKKSKLH